MARKLIEIEASLVESQPNLSTSKSADWLSWVSIFAYAIYLFELLMDVFKADVEGQLQKKQPGTIEWYSEKALAFQNGDTLQVDQWGGVIYPYIDIEKQIIKHASVNENDGTVIIKVAKINAETNELEPLSLTNGEFVNFQRYMENMKFAGTALLHQTLPADVVDYDINVYYDPLYLPNDVQAAVELVLSTFRTELSFDARLYKSDFVAAIQAVEGVKSVKVNNMSVTAYEQDPVTLDVVIELASGYFNYAETSTITMININA